MSTKDAVCKKCGHKFIQGEGGTNQYVRGVMIRLHVDRNGLCLNG